MFEFRTVLRKLYNIYSAALTTHAYNYKIVFLYTVCTWLEVYACTCYVTFYTTLYSYLQVSLF